MIQGCPWLVEIAAQKEASYPNLYFFFPTENQCLLRGISDFAERLSQTQSTKRLD